MFPSGAVRTRSSGSTLADTSRSSECQVADVCSLLPKEWRRSDRQKSEHTHSAPVKIKRQFRHTAAHVLFGAHALDTCMHTEHDTERSAAQCTVRTCTHARSRVSKNAVLRLPDHPPLGSLCSEKRAGVKRPAKERTHTQRPCHKKRTV